MRTPAAVLGALFTSRLPELTAPLPPEAIPEPVRTRDTVLAIGLGLVALAAILAVPAVHLARAGGAVSEDQVWRALRYGTLAVLALYIVLRARFAPTFRYWCLQHGGTFQSARAYPDRCTVCGCGITDPD